MQTKSFKGSLVTGGSRGIGAGIVRRLAADVLATAARNSSAEPLSALQHSHPHCLPWSKYLQHDQGCAHGIVRGAAIDLAPRAITVTMFNPDRRPPI
jgi:NAD(P)-dependent dehydrogenase (short-subunit alcohol dehydrogenase family)